MSERNVRKVKVGKVISDKMDKTVVVAVEELEQHKLYKKPVKRTVKFHAHDEKNDAHVGDKVSLMETRPLSKTKRWRVVEVMEKAVILSDSQLLDVSSFSEESVPQTGGKASNLDVFTLEEAERQAIEAAMKKYGDNLSLVAKALDISRPTLYNKLKKYGL